MQGVVGKAPLCLQAGTCSGLVCYTCRQQCMHVMLLHWYGAADVDAAERVKRVKTEGEWEGATNGTAGQSHCNAYDLQTLLLQPMLQLQCVDKFWAWQSSVR